MARSITRPIWEMGVGVGSGKTFQRESVIGLSYQAWALNSTSLPQDRPRALNVSEYQFSPNASGFYLTS